MKKYIWVALLLSMLFGAGNAYASEWDSEAFVCSSAEHQNYDVKGSLSEERFMEHASMGESMDTSAKSTGKYEYALGNRKMAKMIYESCSDVNETCDGVQLTWYYEKGKDFKDTWDQFKEEAALAMFGYKYDHPARTAWTTSTIDFRADSYGDHGIFYVYFRNSEYYSSSTFKAAAAKVAEIKEAAGDKASRYQKVKYVYDWLLSSNEYDYDVTGSTAEETRNFYESHGVFGCLLKGKGVCESYAKDFKWIMDELKIPCMVITGENHAWNYVMMDDGYWYLVDATFGDTVNEEEKDLFLVTGTSVTYGYGSFTQRYIPDGRYYNYPRITGGEYHSFLDQKIVPAKAGTAGRMEGTCEICGEKRKRTIYSISSVKLSKTSYIYDGRKKRPAVTVKDSKGNVLDQGTDYTVSYPATGSVGTKKVTVKMKGYYGGTSVKSIKILPKKSYLSSLSPRKGKLTVKMKYSASSRGGARYQIAYRKKGSSSWKYKTTSKKSITLKSLKKGKRYQVKVRAYKAVNNKKYYGSWSKVKTSAEVK